MCKFREGRYSGGKNGGFCPRERLETRFGGKSAGFRPRCRAQMLLLLLVFSNFCSIFGEVDKKVILYETFHLLYSI